MRAKRDLLSLTVLFIVVVDSVYGLIKAESRINAVCRLKCEFNLREDKNSNYCGTRCQTDECFKGCYIYADAKSKSPCQSVCSDHIEQVTPELVQSRSLTQIKIQSCTQGCLFSLDQYYEEFYKPGISQLGKPVPEVIKDRITHNSVELSLQGYQDVVANITFILQTRIVDTNTEWQLHNYTELLPSGSLNVTHLLPFVTYQFKLIFEITTEHAHDFTTQASVPVTTLPFGVPSTSPTITSLRAPRPAVIAVSWQPPTYTNGPLVSYRLTLRRLDHSDHVTSVDVPPGTNSWIFGHLHAGQKYEVRISAVNSEGEGPVHAMSVATPNPGNLSEKDMPYLILGAENYVVKQRLLELTREAERIYTKPKSILVLGVGVHIRDELILISDTSGRVSLINISGDVQNDDVYPMLVQPTNINIDWLNDLAYIVDGNRISRCTIMSFGADCDVVLDIAPLLPYELKVDPINGYLYYTVVEGRQGLYRVDLAEFTKSTSAEPKRLLSAELKTFFIDHENLLLYFPNNSRNSIMSSYLDGTGIVDIRQGTVARPHFIDIESIVYYDDKFFWTNGTNVFSEEYDVGNRTYYHNSLLLFERHFRGFNMLYPPAQPLPAPVSPPDKLQVLFTAYKAVIHWDLPHRLVFQGEGAYNTWEYEVFILQDDGSQNSFTESTLQLGVEISNLEPDTRYQVKVCAKSPAGSGPWSDIFYGRTLKEDLAWYEDKVFWTTDAGNLFMYWGETQETIPMSFVSDATCVAFDWLGMKLYWSAYRNGVIRRSEMTYGSDVELVFQAQARDMVIDSIRGRLYWVTLNTVETTLLNGEGHQIYFQEKYFSGKNVISVSVDFESMKIFWYVKGFEDQSLYMADLFGNPDGDDDVLHSVKLVGSFRDIAETSSIQFYSDHLFWSDNSLSLMVGDRQCNYSSEIMNIKKPVTMFTIKHPSIQPYPDNLNKNTVQVIPSTVQGDSIVCTGNHSLFNITWQPASEVNHGLVLYELSLAAEDILHALNVSQNSWYEIVDLPPYTSITVSVRGFTYWGSGPLVTRTVKSPMGVPTQPQAPKVYVTQRKSAASSKLTLAADFRWSEPVEINGVLSHQHVIYWKSSDVYAISRTNLSATARHFILDELEGNTTYFFQVECCTPVGCSEGSIVAKATADAVNPVPKLLIAMEDRVDMAEADNVKNTSETIATKSVVAMSYLALDKTYFWISRDKVLEKYPATSGQHLLKLSGDYHTMTLDWVSRSLYVAEINRTSSRIIKYQIDQSEHSVFMERNQKMGQIVVNPYTSSLIWSEKEPAEGSWKLMKTSTSIQDVAHPFTDDHRNKRAVNNICNCPPSSQMSKATAIDLSQNGETEVIFVDKKTLILLASDMAGCQCRVVLKTDESDRKGLPPDMMTVDHIHIYWYQASTESLYAMDKESKLVSSSRVENVADILAFGSHLQPLPGPECLDMEPYTKQVGVETVTNTSIAVSFDQITWPSVCANISHPSVKYTIHYRELDDMNPNQDCRTPGYTCATEDAFSREITLEGLEPYTYYIIQGAVSNSYSEYSSNSLGEPVTIRTRPGVPEVIQNFTSYSQSPHSIKVSWPTPYPPNGPLDKIVYYVKWSTQSAKGIKENFISDKILFESFNPFVGMFEKDIHMLSSDQTYTVKIVCNQTDGGFVTESAPETVHTYQEPEGVMLKEATNTSIHLTWKSPSDDSIERVGIYCTEVIDGSLSADSIQGNIVMVENYTEYNDSFYNLKPDTAYSFRLDIIYLTSNTIYHLPEDETQLQYVYRTLTGIPDQPDPPIVQEFKEGEFEVTWKAPDDRGEPVSHYMLQYRLIDRENWSFAYNTSDVRWVIDDSVLQRGFTFVFRVLAENKNGMGDYSENSAMFSYPTVKVAEEEKGMVTVIAVGCAFVFVVIIVIFIVIYFSVCKKGKEEKRKTSDFIAVARGPDLELATLRELPLTGVHQNNTLYAINLIPTDDEIAALPHFRRDQLVLCKFLGSGAFGEVFEGVAKNILNEHSGETRCAVKTLRKSASDQEKEEFLKEALLMSNFRHQHILSLLGVCLDNDPQFIILELMEGGDLLSFMRACRLSSIQNRAELSLTDIVKICVHVARGCKYLEDMHFVHRDLAARNCLVSSYNPSSMVVKIGDFGLARDIYKNDYYRKEGEGLLPVRWMSPESLVDGVFTTQSDIWAFGVLMWEVVTFGQQPYPARTNIEVLHYVRSGGRLDRHDNCPDDFYQLMCKCWSFAPEDRPSFAFLLQQLEKFEETCASVSEYLVPIRTHNGPINTADGSRYLTQRSRRLTSTSSDGPDYRSIHHNNYGAHRNYGKIQRATSFDSPEPMDATQRIRTDSSNYLEPKSHNIPPYIEFLPDSRTQNYVYSASGERVRDAENVPTPREPSYVQTTVKENFYPVTEEYMKYLQQNHKSKDQCAETYRKITHQARSDDSVIMKTIENIPSACVGENETTAVCSNNPCSENGRKQSDSSIAYAHMVPGSGHMAGRFRKHRLDSSNSIMSFDSVQTEPAYSDFNNYRNKLYSSSSSKSNYSVSNISECINEIPAMTNGQEPSIDEEAIQYWASNKNNAGSKGHSEVKGLIDYCNLGKRSQVYPETIPNGYDIVQASLV